MAAMHDRRGGKRYRALLISNSSFPDDPHNLSALEGPRNDPALLRDALCDDRYGMFAGDDVRLVLERDTSEVLDEVEEFLHDARHDDAVLLYYSGHGRLDTSNELYLCARNTRTDRIRTTAVKASDIKALIEDSAAGTTIVILDCCHSGAFKGGGFAEKFAGRGRYVLTSCRTGELANDSSGSNRGSLFTHHLVEGMLGGAADHDGDGLIILEDLYHYTYEQLRIEGRQIPERRFAGSGDVPLARRPVAAPAPILDVSPAVIRPDDVRVGDRLPPERIAVVNRGGGDLVWGANCESDWITLRRDEVGLVVYLHPGRVGVNRANVHVRDQRTGEIETVRIAVNVLPPRAAPVSPQPAPPSSTREQSPAEQPTQPAAVQTSTVPAGPSPDARSGRWKVRHSIWLLATLPLSVTTWAGFLYVGVRAKQRSWIVAAIAYGIALVVALTLSGMAPSESEGDAEAASWESAVAGGILATLWIGGIVHGLIINREWLRWRESTAKDLRPR
jgi:caspase domain-containing protein